MSLDAALRDGGRRWDDRLAVARESDRLPVLPREAWIDATDPHHIGAWERRIGWAGLNGHVNGAAELLGDEPAWLATVEWIRDAATEAASEPLADIDSELPFAHIFRPVVATAWARLSQQLNCGHLADGARADLQEALLVRLCAIAARPLGELFGSNRTLADVALIHITAGTTPGASTERYEHFCREMLTTGLEPILRSFPVLGRLLATILMQWESFCRELISRLGEDRPAIEQTFSIPSNALVTSLTTGLSDPHQEGRAVVIVGFGEHGRIVYKPHPVEIEQRYQDFLGTVSAALAADPLRQLKVLARPGYGYIEYVEAQVAPPDALPRFYRNAGRVLAVLFLLGATDCHWENMVAAGDQMVLVDAETLLEGTPESWDKEQSEPTRSAASESMAESVLRTGMLPAWISVGPGESIDISALGTPGSDRARPPRPAWCFPNTDDMVWGDREGTSVRATCLPIGEGEPNPLSGFVAPLVDGFDEVLTLIARPDVRACLRADLEHFRGARRRIVVRPTRTYVLLQADALALDCLRNANARAIQLDRLARAYTGSTEKPPAWPILEHEITAMENLDVPYFEGAVGSRGLFDAGREVVGDYYETEGLEQALLRLDRVSDAERRWQAKLIHGAIAAHRFEMRSPENFTAGESSRESRAGSHSASDVAGLIRSDALDEPSGRPTWLTVALLADATRVQLGLVPPGLYDGRAGIAAFLYDCGDIDLADTVLAPVIEALNRPDESTVLRYARDIGFGMAGVGGILRLFQYRAATSCEPDVWLARSEHVAQMLNDSLLAADPASDLVSGIAGLAAPVAKLYTTAPTPDAKRLLNAVGHLLLDRQEDDGGWAFGVGHPPLVGLSHGASGIAVALAEIAVVSGDDRYSSAADRAIDFERCHYDPQARNWPDLRRGSVEYDRLAMRSWCHGSVGVAFARTRLLELLGTHDHAARWADDLAVAVESSIAVPLGPVDHICCGNLGRALAIRLAGQFSGNASWEDAGVEISNNIAALAGDSPNNYRLLLGMDGAHGLRLPGLMTGLAGIGMNLLHGDDLGWVRHLLI